MVLVSCRLTMDNSVSVLQVNHVLQCVSCRLNMVRSVSVLQVKHDPQCLFPAG